jgi:Heterokaryon incompatibility protein (HET)
VFPLAVIIMNRHDKFQYEPLKYHDSIRVLNLLPAETGELLQCQLCDIRMGENPHYEALSYTWGNPAFSKHIDVIGRQLKHRIFITENLFAALQAYRRQDTARVLWIDAICINQTDNDEKNQQVALMASIYKSAEHVLAWLGGETHNDALQQLERIGRDCNLYGMTTIFPFKRELEVGSLEAHHLQLLADDESLRPLAALFLSPWFERVWIVQEFVLAKDLSLQAKDRSITYDHLSKAVAVLVFITKTWPNSLRAMGDLSKTFFYQFWFLIQTKERYMAWQNNVSLKRLDSSYVKSDYSYDLNAIRPMSLLELCYSMTLRKCADGRDRLYSLLGYADNALSIKPNYNASAEQVWMDLALKTLVSGDLTGLHYAGQPYKRTHGIPSYVAEFDYLSGSSAPKRPVARLGGFGTVRFQAGAGYHPSTEVVSYQGSQTIALKGVLVDVISDEVPLSNVADTSAATSRFASTSFSGTNIAAAFLESDFRLPSQDTFIELFTSLSKLVPARRHENGEWLLQSISRMLVADNGIPSLQHIMKVNGPRGVPGGDAKLCTLLYALLMFCYPDENNPGQYLVEDQLIGNLLKAAGIQKPFKFSFLSPAKTTTYSIPYPVEGEGVTLGAAWARTLNEAVASYLERYCTVVSMVLFRRCLFTTSKGHIGFGPDALKPGDVVVVFDGAQTPFVLRKSTPAPRSPPGSSRAEKRNHAYELIGECYFHVQERMRSFYEVLSPHTYIANIWGIPIAFMPR